MTLLQRLLDEIISPLKRRWQYGLILQSCSWTNHQISGTMFLKREQRESKVEKCGPQWTVPYLTKTKHPYQLSSTLVKGWWIGLVCQLLGPKYLVVTGSTTSSSIYQNFLDSNVKLNLDWNWEIQHHNDTNHSSKSTKKAEGEKSQGVGMVQNLTWLQWCGRTLNELCGKKNK